ncbi:prolipoprotein diacylglyceryl transferase family protein [Halodurantibacterium flavum]|uniref:Prolipoprotein diacylglyceryl transferase family protein n=1 Tax=Halodurantibacterium flavum TaxID=1382802 RepID=A0ABW4S518_9RHOB
MNAIAIGPLVFSAERLAAIVGIGLFLVAAEVWGLWRGRRAHIASWAFAAVAVGILSARLGFVLANLESYRQTPLDVFAVWQGGFASQIGVYGFVAVVIVSLLRGAAVARPLVVSALVGALGFQAVEIVSSAERLGRLPEARFADLSGTPVTPADRNGKPLVLNLWASWCPPCVREMPMMVEVAGESDAVDILFANQGETPERIRRFLEVTRLDGDRILLDPQSALMEKFGTVGLPATLFFDAEGRVQAVHVGEISRAELTARMQDLQQNQQLTGDET